MATPTPDPPPSPPRGGEAPVGPFAAPQIGEAQRRFWLIVDAMIAALIVIGLVGGWAYVQVRGSLSELRAAGLASLLEAEGRALQLWIAERRNDAERWAATPQVQREGARLAALGAPAACEPGSQRAFREAIAPYMAVEEVAVFNLIGRDGRILSSPQPGLCGAPVTARFLRALGPVFEGRTTFVGPWEEAARIEARAPGLAEGPLVWAETPIRGAGGGTVAALGFGRVAATRFARLLELTTGGTSRDAFAFDETGLIVTLPRDRSRSSVAGTALARAALDRSQGSQGVVLEPYASYRGTPVIAAWRWLPEERLGVAVEVEAQEAYGPLEYLQVAFGVLFTLVLVSMTAAASTSLWALRSRMREAKRVGQYEIEREIGEGGMSHVYLARHATLKRPAAVKVLKPHLATDEAVARFRREAQICSQLTHPNTVEVFDYGTTREGRWYYAMEYLEGVSIDEVVRRSGPLPVARVAHALLQACGSLAEAHAHGWVHRDVKPQNLLLCARGGRHDVVKVLDFGIVKQVRNPDTRDITQYSRILGTPLYMAPERLRNPADADARADVYALGAVAWFAIAGRPAFEAQTEHDIVYRVMNEPAPRLAEAAPGVPPELDQLVARCLAKDRAERPAGIDEVQEVLARIARDDPWTEARARAWWDRHGGAAGPHP
jgi:serine/threonine-protein kinase